MWCRECGRSFKGLVCLGVVLCFLATWSALPTRSAWALSLAEEKELGRKILEMLRDRLPLVEDDELITYVRSVGQRIVKQVGVTPYEFQFFVVNESVPNAFAIPGGFIFIYRGLMEMMENEGELASILAHELAHIQARHIHRRIEESRMINIASLAGVVAGVLLGMSGGSGAKAAQALTLGTMAGARSYQLQYSRENEREADQIGLRYLTDAGYPPKDMVSIMERMNQDKWRVSSKLPSYLSTHPALGERVLYLKEQADRMKASGKPAQAVRLREGDFELMQAAMVADYTDPRVALDRFQVEAREAGKGRSAVSEYGLGRLHLRQGNVKDALPHLQEAARMASSSPYVMSSLGAVYFQLGKLDEAQRALETVLVLNPTSTVAHLRLARVLQDQGKRAEALKHLQQIEEMAPSFPEIDRLLGVLLGQLNRIGPAHYHLARYHEQRREWKLAQFHYQKARTLTQDSPRTVEEIDNALKEIEQRRKKEMWEKSRDR
ncbi:MAG: tetratricopeptide repeat protein [Syntrophobacteraceae bacterium]|jgi:predicted Zn-dependent protease|nr:tetratricopeptide repeat protein [Syntrophobacteraceae bacterium]